MRFGIDAYSFHRLLGEFRIGEDPLEQRFPDGSLDAVRFSRNEGVEVISLETSFLGAPDQFDRDRYRREAGDMSLILSWGHPDGLWYGARPENLDELLQWIGEAAALNETLMRITVAGPGTPRPEGDWTEPTIKALRRALQRANECGVRLALENHTDITLAEMTRLLDACEGLVACLDTSAAVRLGDDPVKAARDLGERVAIVHLKDTEKYDPENPPWADESKEALGGALGRGVSNADYGTGMIDVAGVMRALTGTPDVAVLIELSKIPNGVDELQMIRNGLTWLRAESWKSSS